MLEPRQPMLEPSERRPLTDLPEPARRVRAKTAIGDYAERSADPPGEQPAPESGAVLPPPGLAPAVDGQGQPFVSEPDLEYTPSEPPIEPELPDTEMTADHGEKREHEDDTTEDIVSPPDKRQRVEFLETVLQKCGMTKKRKEHTAKDFTGKDWHRLIKAIAKEINQNLASGAYELLDRTTSEEVRRSKLDKIMGSRYVLVKKPLEDAEVDKARVEDLSLDDQEHGPVKAKCRHVMQGFRNPTLLTLRQPPHRSQEMGLCL